MIARKSVKAVGVVTNMRELQRAIRMPLPPHLFEIRLDHFGRIDQQLENKLSILEDIVPLIMTARHPREGGAHNLSTAQRRGLLVRFLPFARYIDVELRSVAAMRSVLKLAHRKKTRLIVSFHDFNSTTSAARLATKARAAKSIGADIFKVAVRTDTRTQLAHLLEFATNENVDLPLSTMGIGKLGRESRRELIRRGSVLNYGHLGRGRIAGQPSIFEICDSMLEIAS
jgi:3-dehydroquinate dehydratase I